VVQKIATAEWADPEVFAKSNAFKPGKFWLGRSPIDGKPLGYDDDRHVCLVSGSRSGKGTSTIIPNLCLWPGSIVVVDPKGENATITAARRGPGSERCEGMGQKVHVLDPFGVARVDDAMRSRFNPLDAIDPKSSRAIDEAGSLADAIVVISPDTKEPFWDESARSLIKTLILHVLTSPLYEGRRNLVTVRQLITRGDHEGIEVMKRQGREKHPSPQELLWFGVGKNENYNGVIAGFGQSMRDMLRSSPKQFNSILQIANRNTEFLDSPDMQRSVEASDFKLSELKTDPKGISVYLSLPPQYMGEHFRWLRMMVTLTIFEMQSVAQQPACGHRVLVCLDEFAGLERMKIVETAVAQIAGFGVKLFFVLQSLEQLKATYRDGWETFLANSGMAMFYGVGDHFTRDHVSKMIGDTELIRELATSNRTESQQTNTTSGATSSTTWNTQATKGTGSGSSASDNWKSLPMGLRQTAAFISAISGNQTASRSTNASTNQSQSQSDGGSQAQQNSTSEGQSQATASGQNESLQKRALITPDEVGRFFGRIDDKNDPVYPGLGLTVHVSGTPSPVQRVNYFDDPHFLNKHDPHPDHPSTAMIESTIDLIPPKASELIRNLNASGVSGSSLSVSMYDYGEIPRRVSKGEIIASGVQRVGMSAIHGTRYRRPIRQWDGDTVYFDMKSPCDGFLLGYDDGRITMASRTELDQSILQENKYEIARWSEGELESIFNSNRKNRWGDLDQYGGMVFVLLIGIALCVWVVWSTIAASDPGIMRWVGASVATIIGLGLLAAVAGALARGFVNVAGKADMGRSGAQQRLINELRETIEICG